MKKRVTIGLMWGALGLVACGGPFASPAAVVNGEEITARAVRREVEVFASSEAFKQQATQGDPQTIKRGFEQVTLTRLIRRAVLEPEGAALGIEVTDEDITARIDQFREERGLTDEAAFEEFLKEQGVTPEQLRELARDTVLEERLREEITSGVEPTEAEVRAEYDRRAAQGEYSQTRASHIVVDTQKQAARIEQQLRAVVGGEPELDVLFADLARRRSKDKESAKKGGDLGFSSPGLFVPEFQDALENLEVGEFSGPVQTQAGWHIILVTDRRNESFDEVRTSLVSQLRSGMREQAWNEWVIDAYRRADIEVNPRYGVLDIATGAVRNPSADDLPGVRVERSPVPVAPAEPAGG